MPVTITNGYITLDELKGHLQSSGLPNQFKPEDEINMGIAIEAMSRLVDEMVQTNFYGSTETRYFTAYFKDLLYIDDLISVTTLKTGRNSSGVYEVSWATTDYWLEPRNARLNADAEQMKPYRQIRVNPDGDFSFPTSTDHGVEIVGSWGYTTAAIPAIKQVMLLMANRIYRRKDAIFGIAGTPQLGVQIVRAKIQEDTDIMNLLQNGIDYRGW